ncbi:hypothetical protein TNCV_952611 [Trichonephila clavipes]|nr:hypothetical protein TNCV_952611 [Trichonephila clavipes]
MTAQRYVHDILQPHVLLLMQQIPGANVQQVNAENHTARKSRDCLCTVTTFPWHAQSQISLQSIISGISWDGDLDILRVGMN